LSYVNGTKVLDEETLSQQHVLVQMFGRPSGGSIPVALHDRANNYERIEGDGMNRNHEEPFVFEQSVTGECDLTVDAASSWHHAPGDALDLIF